MAEFFFKWGEVGGAYLMGTGEVGKFEEMEEKRDGWEMAVDKERERLKLE